MHELLIAHSCLKFVSKMTSEHFLLETELKQKEPFSLFKEWFDEASHHPDIPLPNVITLSTVNKHGQPSSMMMFLQGFNEEDFKFFTDYGSQKAKDLEENPNVAIVIYWHSLQRSVRIEGTATKVSSEENLKVFRSLPRKMQVERFARGQDQAVPSREFLEEKTRQTIAELGDGEVPLPNWGGYLVVPRLVDFWQGRTNESLNDRIRFRKFDGNFSQVNREITHVGENGWIYERLTS